jgi:hypothetical protein
MPITTVLRLRWAKLSAKSIICSLLNINEHWLLKKVILKTLKEAVDASESLVKTILENVPNIEVIINRVDSINSISCYITFSEAFQVPLFAINTIANQKYFITESSVFVKIDPSVVNEVRL